MVNIVNTDRASARRNQELSPAAERLRLARILSLMLAIDVTVGGLVTLLVPSVLRGPAVMNGSARGTALIAVVVAVPLLVGSVIVSARGSERATVVWAGCLSYLAYNGVMFLFATPYNRLFPLYVGMLSLAIWSLICLLLGAEPRRIANTKNLRFVASYMWVIVALNTAAWLATIVPDLVDAAPGTFTEGTGVATNPVFVQDLTFWLPAMAIAAWLLWTGHIYGWLLAGTGLIYWQIESIGVAVDQWWGHQADPDSTVVSVAAVPMFLGLFVVGLVPCWLLFRHLHGASGPLIGDHGPSSPSSS